jgi:hypothetical protein
MGIGMIIGGALKGYGDGMAEMARSREEERRLSALENLRTRNDQANLQVQADLTDRNAERSDKRGDYYDARKTERTTSAQITVDGARTKNDMTLEQLRQKNTEALTRLQSSLRINEAQRESAIRMQEEAIKANTYIQDFQTDDQGNLVGITATGKVVRPGVRPMPDAPKGGDSIASIVAARQAGGATAANTPAPTPAPSKQVAQTGSAPRLRDDAAAEAFVSNPANRGKSFIGPDGKQYRVPMQ